MPYGEAVLRRTNRTKTITTGEVLDYNYGTYICDCSSNPITVVLRPFAFKTNIIAQNLTNPLNLVGANNEPIVVEGQEFTVFTFSTVGDSLTFLYDGAKFQMI